MGYISQIYIFPLPQIVKFCFLYIYIYNCCRWKALDFAALKRCSISFFEPDRSETAVSRWARARTRAAMVSFFLSFFIN